MPPEIIRFAPDGQARWAGMGDFVLVSPDGMHRIELTYIGEPPHGDSYHRATIDGVAFPGEVWGCLFAFSTCSRHLVFSWMAKRYERRTAVVDLQKKHYFVLPWYLYRFSVHWPTIVGEGEWSGVKDYTVGGTELWLPY